MSQKLNKRWEQSTKKTKKEKMKWTNMNKSITSGSKNPTQQLYNFTHVMLMRTKRCVGRTAVESWLVNVPKIRKKT